MDNKFHDMALEAVNALNDFAKFEFVSPVIATIALHLRQAHADGVAEARTVLECIEVDLEAGDIPAKTRVALALSRVKATLKEAKQ